MRTEAASGGFYISPFTGDRHPKIQLRTIADLMGGKGIDYPRTRADATFKQAPRAEAGRQVALNLALPYDASSDPAPSAPKKRKR